MTNVVPLRTPTIRVTEALLIDATKDRIAISVANDLLAEGYHIVSIQTETRCRPVIWLAPDHRLAAQVARDNACYYRQGRDEYGAYRIGQFERGGAAIQWRERHGKTPWWGH